MKAVVAVLLLAVVAGGAAPAPAQGPPPSPAPIPWVDVHLHLVTGRTGDFPGAVDAAVRRGPNTPVDGSPARVQWPPVMEPLRRKKPKIAPTKLPAVNVVSRVPLTPERVLERIAKRFLVDAGAACGKCGSTFVDREPAFVHCRYCGAMARIANASLALQEEFELRSGLRLAS